MPKNPLSSRLLVAAIAVLVVTASAVMSGTAYASTIAAPPEPAAPASEVTSTTGTTNTIAPASTRASPASSSVVSPKGYLPLVQNSWPLATVFGIETGNLAGQVSPILGSGATWVRRNALQWKDVEPTEGARNWSAAVAVEADMVAAAKDNARLILIIHGTPTWAQAIPNTFCAPIRADKISAFAAFVRDAAARYSQPPYNVKYWEIWNEPDLGRPWPPPATPITQPYGCWGDPNDPYYGGGYYASILTAVTPQIKAVDPSAKVIVGGLLLGCSVDNPPAGGCESGKYLEGILRGGGAPHFDGISFHAYDYFDASANTVGVYVGGVWPTAWNTAGPVVTAKAQFIKRVLNQFGVTGKFLMNTEVGLLWWECITTSPQFETTKAYYVAQSYSAAIAEGLAANVWYSFEGWFCSSLNDPTYTAFKTARAKLLNATFAGDVTTGDVGASGVKGYKFNRNGKSVWVIWSLDGSAKNVTLTGTPAAITDPMGTSVATAVSFQLTVKPLYIEFP